VRVTPRVPMTEKVLAVPPAPALGTRRTRRREPDAGIAIRGVPADVPDGRGASIRRR